MHVRLRTLVLVAAALAVIMLSACTTGHTRAGRPSASSATDSSGVLASNGSSTTSTPPDHRAEFAARPLHLPVVGRGQACPTSGGAPINAGGFGGVAQGPGPVHPIGADVHGVAQLISSTQYPAGWRSSACGSANPATRVHSWCASGASTAADRRACWTTRK